MNGKTQLRFLARLRVSFPARPRVRPAAKLPSQQRIRSSHRTVYVAACKDILVPVSWTVKVVQRKSTLQIPAGFRQLTLCSDMVGVEIPRAIVQYQLDARMTLELALVLPKRLPLSLPQHR